MYNRVKTYIGQNQMITPGDHVIAGVSGGADSVCLFFMLLALKKEIPFTMRVAHINHMLRQEASGDEAFVIDLCLKHGIEYRIFAKDIKKYAHEQGYSLEEAGREYRYQCFREMLDEAGAGKIAVAHHQDDHAETIIFNLFRGSGLRGLSGIRPVRNNIIRPLLCLNRKEIEQYLEINNITCQTDKTNADDIYTRNHIRQHIMPFAAGVNKKAVKHMAKTAELVWEAESFLIKHTEKAFLECVDFFPGQIKINLIKLDEQDIIIKKRILLMAVEKLLLSLPKRRVNISASHIDSLIGLKISGGSQRISLPGGLIALKEYDTLVIKIEEKELIEFKHKNAPVLSYKINLGEPKQKIPDLGAISCRIFEADTLGLPDLCAGKLSVDELAKIFPQKIYTKWFDYDKITSYALFRQRLAGDYLIINRKGQHKKLKDYLINEKIPKAKRDKMLVLADESHIIWVPGFRISEFYKVTNETKTILEVKLSLAKEEN
ncbi:MAG: tRNA lysidine(34) synthetase TilS [Lachnospiraceae bacterium]|nr:tRNA lysidine(34) synthetase TilS [Lachnospiraceae bacterium]